MFILLVIPAVLEAFYTPHKPIEIRGDDELNEANGVVSGSGTENDPYIIAGWSIDIDTSQHSITGIAISYTTKFIIIRDCYIFSNKKPDDFLTSVGISTYEIGEDPNKPMPIFDEESLEIVGYDMEQLLSAINNIITCGTSGCIKIEKVRIENAGTGIAHYSSTISSITNSVFTNNIFHIWNISNINSISDCEFTNGEIGSDPIRSITNSVFKNTDIEINEITNSLTNSVFTDSGLWGIGVIKSIKDCTFEGNTSVGLDIDSMTNCNVTGKFELTSINSIKNISNCIFKGNVLYLDTGSITNSSVIGVVDAYNSFGSMTNFSITNCGNTINISKGSDITIESCDNPTCVTDGFYITGNINSVNNCSITNCTDNGTVKDNCSNKLNNKV